MLVKVLHYAKTCNRPNRVASRSADTHAYDPKGVYWQGGDWPGANYMVISGLNNKGYTQKAKEIAQNHYNNVFEVYKNTGTFWEYYAPEEIEQGFMARNEFVGWGGLPPIAVFIEYILGIRSNFAENSVVWDITQTEAHGIERYPFGPEGLVSFKVNKRGSPEETPSITIESDVPFKLTIYWGKNKSKTVEVKEGRHTI